MEKDQKNLLTTSGNPAAGIEIISVSVQCQFSAFVIELMPITLKAWIKITLFFPVIAFSGLGRFDINNKPAVKILRNQKLKLEMRKIIIEDALFDLFPEFCRCLVIVKSIENHEENPEVDDLFRARLEKSAQSIQIDDPRLEAWNQAHRQFESNPNKYPPSIKSLVKRVLKSPDLPFINSVVALFNYISLKYCLPCGGDDLAAIEGNLVLGIARGDESFRGLGATKTETPKPGEVIYYDSANKNVMCRRWNWRNGDDTKITATSQGIVINIDCLPPIPSDTGFEARDELADLLTKHCSANLRVDYLDYQNRETEF